MTCGSVRYSERCGFRCGSFASVCPDHGDFRTELAGIGQARACLELLAKLLGELDERPQVNVVLSAEWISVRAVLLSALAPFPDARAAVAARLQALEAS